MGRIANNDARSLLTTLETFEPRLPGRLIEGQTGDAGASGERRLMIALLADALGDFRKYVFPHTRRQTRLYQESEDWLLGEMKGEAVPVSYVCEVLGLNISYFRSELRRWRDRERARGCRCENARAETTPVKPIRPAASTGPARWKRFLPTAWPTNAQPVLAAATAEAAG